MYLYIGCKSMGICKTGGTEKKYVWEWVWGGRVDDVDVCIFVKWALVFTVNLYS